MKNIINWFISIPENFKEFILAHDRSAILWICLFFGGMAVFFLTYKALHKDE